MNFHSIHTYNQTAANQGTRNNPAKLPTGAVKDTVDAFDKAIAYTVSTKTGVEASKSIGNIAEELGSVEEQLKADAKAAKMQLKALFNKLSGAEAVKLDEDGFDINDIEEEELVTVVDRIKLMLAAYNENFQAFAGAFGMPDEEAVREAGAGVSAGMTANLAAAKSSADSMEMMAEDVKNNLPLNDSTKEYMIANDIDISVENIYMAQHSSAGMQEREALSGAEWEQIRGQVEKMLAGSELQGDEKALEDALLDARWLVEREIPVTMENLLKKHELDTFSLDAGSENVLERAAKAISVIHRASYQQVSELVRENNPVTIESMAAKLSLSVTKIDIRVSADVTEPGRADENAMKAYRHLCEARILMTARSAVSLQNRGLDIYKEDLEHLVSLLHEEEVKFMEEELTRANAGSIATEDVQAGVTEGISTVVVVQDALMMLRFAPCAAIGTIATQEKATGITIQSVRETAWNMQRQYEQAGEAYETMSTKVRSDLGDSVKAAMKNSGESILADLGYEINEVNLRAVRILAYNHMEMSQSNLNQVKSLDSILNQLMDNMTPEITYDLIKKGINPMETSLEELNQYINEQYDNVDSTVKYSEFLYKLEHQENLTDKERSQYIGIYKMFHLFKKDGGKAVGALMNQNAKLSLKNLVMAIQSQRQYGMDVSLDENAGLATVVGQTEYYNNLFRNLTRTVSPAGLKAAGEEMADEGLENMSLEHLSELMEHYRGEDAKAQEEYYTQMLQEMEQFTNIEDSVMRLITDYEVPVTFYNMMAASELVRNAGLFSQIKKQGRDEVNEKMEAVLDHLEDADSMDEAYEELNEAVNKAKEDVFASEQEDSYVDIRQWKFVGKTMNLMGTLGRAKQYFIPFATEEGMGSIHLKLVSDGENAGRMEMNFSTEKLGNVYVAMQSTNEAIRGCILTDDRQAGDMLSANVDNIKQSLGRLGINECDIRTGYSEMEVAGSLHTHRDKTPSALLYREAKAILTNLLAI